jgi:hypothetical protein
MPTHNIAFYSSTPGQGKTTACRILSDMGYLTMSFASPLKSMLQHLCDEARLSKQAINYYFTEAKEEVIPTLGASYRTLTRTLATEWGREMINPDIWLKILAIQFYHVSERAPKLRFCVDDLRFKNELEFLQEKNFKIVKIMRATNRDPEQDQHASDTSLNFFDNFDDTIYNNGSLDDLKNDLLRVIE